MAAPPKESDDILTETGEQVKPEMRSPKSVTGTKLRGKTPGLWLS
jgi:hypothetical protein